MIRTLTSQRVVALALLALAAVTRLAVAGDLDDADLDSRFRAKIIKEKARQASINRSHEQRLQGQSGNPGAECGSQNIGVVDTGGRIGAAPREIFVFAPNAINVVSGRGCGG